MIPYRYPTFVIKIHWDQYSSPIHIIQYFLAKANFPKCFLFTALCVNVRTYMIVKFLFDVRLSCSLPFILLCFQNVHSDQARVGSSPAGHGFSGDKHAFFINLLSKHLVKN
jgi:hypothetical protein